MSSPTLRRYRVPGSELDCGGVIVIGDDGYFSAVTDFGNYAYGWWPCSDFRSALCKFSADYICKKLGPEVYDEDATLAGLKEHIDNDGFDVATNLQELDLLSLIKGHGEPGFWAWYADTTLADASERMRTSPPSDLRNFAAHIWPRFVAMLRAEMEQEERIAEHARGTR